MKTKKVNSNRLKKYVSELKSIAKENGGILRCEDVVSYARNPKTKLHGWFNWNDTEAAKQWRLQQARNLIRVSVSILPQAKVESRVFISMHDDRRNDGGGYRPLEKVLSNKDMRKVLLDEAIEELEWFRRKYQCLKELAEVFSAFDRVKRKKAG